MTTPQTQAALLREAAQNALTTLDGIANANPRDTADFETPAEWIVWAKSRARWAADALREPIAQEVYAERILKQMLHEDSKATQADHFPDAGKMIEPAQAGELPPVIAYRVDYPPEAGVGLPRFFGADDKLRMGTLIGATGGAPVELCDRAALAARKPLMPTDAQVTAAAKALCDEFAADCNVDRDDSWMIHGEEFKDSARRALIAAHAIGLEVKP